MHKPGECVLDSGGVMVRFYRNVGNPLELAGGITVRTGERPIREYPMEDLRAKGFTCDYFRQLLAPQTSDAEVEIEFFRAGQRIRPLPECLRAASAPTTRILPLSVVESLVAGASSEPRK